MRGDGGCLRQLRQRRLSRSDCVIAGLAFRHKVIKFNNVVFLVDSVSLRVNHEILRDKFVDYCNHKCWTHTLLYVNHEDGASCPCNTTSEKKAKDPTLIQALSH